MKIYINGSIFDGTIENISKYIPQVSSDQLDNSDEEQRTIPIEEQIDYLRHENADLRAQLLETQDALIELAEIITEI